MPHAIVRAVVRHHAIRARTERRRERRCNSALERVACETAHLDLDLSQREPFALADLDEEELQQVPVAVGRRRARAVRMIEQPGGHIESNRAGTRLRSRGAICGAHPRGVDESRGVRREAARVPRRVPRVRTEEWDRRFGHDSAIYGVRTRREAQARSPPCSQLYFQTRLFPSSGLPGALLRSAFLRAGLLRRALSGGRLL